MNTSQKMRNVGKNNFMRKLALSDEILLKISQPARYIGGEVNMVKKDPSKVAVRFAMCFPDVYEIGMSHLGIQILYDMFNRRDDVYCERVYSPWMDLDPIMREQKIPLFAVESQDPIKKFDFLGITIQYEMCYTNILQVLELSQIPLHAEYDFYMLYQKYGCNMQFGGDDQWSNMLGGTELIRRKLGKDAHAMTITLLLNSEGKKMGKTQSGAVWLDPNKTSPFEFYQYWRNVADADVLKCLRMLTFLPLEQIDEMDKWEGSQLNTAKEILAYELTKLVHGEEEAEKAQAAAKALFSSGNAANMPTYELTEDDFNGDAIDILSILQKSGLAPSRSEARRNVEQGGVSVDGNQVKDVKAVFTKDQLSGEGMVVKRGKKNFKKVVLK